MDTSLFFRIIDGTVSEVTMPDTLTIGNSAFARCSFLTTANFPACTKIGTYAFAHCSFLTTASFPACTMIDSSAFYNCSFLTNISFPACTMINNGAFYNCSFLTTANFPACSIIDWYAFSGCYCLISLYLTGSSVCRLNGSNAFTSSPIGGYSGAAGQYGSIYVPASRLANYQAATNWTYFSSRFVGV